MAHFPSHLKEIVIAYNCDHHHHHHLQHSVRTKCHLNGCFLVFPQFTRVGQGFVHMRYWAVNVPEVAAFRNALLASETRKVVYNHHWFWKCAASRTPKPVKQRVSTEPYIMLDSAPTATSSEPPPSTEPQHHTPGQEVQSDERPAGVLEDVD